MTTINEIKIEDMFSAEALEALKQLPQKCKVGQEHCITLLELDKQYEKDKSNSSKKE